ncbi:probable fructokinase-5 isoform X2 [Carica papaya]|uniref:probable fructokinase-5 isoform X2 n=1 Tax=Carica papaya TaxID=3649 RepID=UPI000B8CA315|nr:probable fructokinase-5 isoform X2 [Carica papaya]
MEEKMGRKSPLIVSFGEMLIDFVPDKAGLSLADSTGFLKAPGGAPANVACAISKLQGNSAFIGKLGDDEFGQMLVDILKKNGVNTDGVCFDGEARTALAFVTLKKNGEREFAFYRNPSADMLMKESELNMGLIRAAKIFHYGSISLISEPCRSAHLSAMDAAKAAGAWLSYDPNVRLPLWPSPQYARDAIFSIWTYADIIKDFKGRVKGFSVKTIDTTGAGDAFVGALLVYLAQDPTIVENEEKLMEALTFANACGAISTTQKGAIPALPTISDALQLINSKPRASNYFTRTFMLFLVSSVLISILFSFIFGHNKT